MRESNSITVFQISKEIGVFPSEVLSHKVVVIRVVAVA